MDISMDIHIHGNPVVVIGVCVCVCVCALQATLKDVFESRQINDTQLKLTTDAYVERISLIQHFTTLFQAGSCTYLQSTLLIAHLLSSQAQFNVYLSSAADVTLSHLAELDRLKLLIATVL